MNLIDMAIGKNINLFLMDGTPMGELNVHLLTRHGISYKIPQRLLEEAHTLNYINQARIYFLFGISEYNENNNNPYTRSLF